MSPRDIASDHVTWHHVVIGTLIRAIQIDEHIEQGLRLNIFVFFLQHPLLFLLAICLYLNDDGTSRIGISREDINALRVMKRDGRDVAPPRQLCRDEILA